MRVDVVDVQAGVGGCVLHTMDLGNNVCCFVFKMTTIKHVHFQKTRPPDFGGAPIE